MGKKIFQILLACIGLFPIYGGIRGIIGGASRFMGDALSEIPNDGLASIDSHYRFYSATIILFTLVLYHMLPNIEKYKTGFRLFCLWLFLGGLARVITFIQIGIPYPQYIAATAIELLFPLFILWHNNIIKNSK